MDTEFEAKAIKIDKDEVRKKLSELGAELVFPEKLFTRAVFKNNEHKDSGAWIRLRDEGDKITLSLKQVSDESKIEGTSEISFEVNAFEPVEKFLLNLGYAKENHQQNYREEWQLDDVIFDIDTWPMIDPYLEIEGPSEELIRKYFDKLGFDYSKAYFGSSNIVYKEVYGIDIISMSELLFTGKQDARLPN